MSQGKWRVLGFASVVFFLPIAASLSAGLAPSFAQTLPTLPQATVETTMPTVTGETYVVTDGGNLQNALNDAAAADPTKTHQVVLQAGGIFTGAFTLPSRPGASGWLIIRSSALTSLPPQGTRVTSSDAANMPTIRSNTLGFGPFTTEDNADRYWLLGLNITMTSSASPVQTALVRFGTGGEDDTRIPKFLVLDRCWVHGGTTAATQTRNLVYLNANSVAIVDSLLTDAQEVGSESHAVSGWNSAGPWKIDNNRIEAASINILVGGGDPVVSGTGNPFDIRITRNYFTKQLRWKKDDPAWDGESWVVKNALEFKAGTRVLVEGNVIERSWGDAQEGWLVRLVLGSDLRADIADVTFRNNILQHGGYGLDICGNCSTAQFVIRRVLIENTLMTDIDPATWNAPGGGWAFMVRNGAQDITIRHNTLLQGGTFLVFTRDLLTEATLSNVSLTDNIANHGPDGVFGDGGTVGTAALDQYVAGWSFKKNALIELTVPEDQYPADNFFPAELAAVGFVDPANGDYHLAPSSPYKNAATDGKDIGADMDALLAAIGGVLSADSNNPGSSSSSGGTAASSGGTAASSGGTAASSGGTAASGGGGGGCFIATAAYGSSLAPQVILLRTFRDRHLMTTSIGHAFVRWYYRTSPPVAEWVRQTPTLRALIRWSLWPVVAVVWLILHPVAGLGALIGGGGASVWLWSRR